MVESHAIQRKFTVNGTFIPQDSAGNDMCILFMKYGRCRFKTKCKKSHWVPPLPDEPYPFENKPPLPTHDQIDKGKTSNAENVADSFNNDVNTTETVGNICSKSNLFKKLDGDVKKLTKTCMFSRRFKHVFQGNCNDSVSNYQYSAVNRLFEEVGAYFDNVTQKLQTSQPPQNKVEKHHLKVLRRINWRNTQNLKEKLSQYPPSYNLKFDRSKINFTRLKPYIYVLVHECMCVDGVKKPVKPSSFEYLIADTLMAYLESKCITAQEAEVKLQQWGARPVRARQCVAHLWHILAISSKSSLGCAEEILTMEEDVMNGTRTALDYACACAFALKRVKFQEKIAENLQPRRKVSSSVIHRLEARRVRNTKHVTSLRGSLTREENENKIKCREKHVRRCPERGNETAKSAYVLPEHEKTLMEFSQHAETSNLCTELRTGHVEIEHAGNNAGYDDKNSKDRADNFCGGLENTVLNVEDITKCATKDTKHVQEKTTHVIPAAHAKLHEINTRTPTENAGVTLKHSLCKSIRKRRQRSKQFKNVPFNERTKLKERYLQLLQTS